MVITTHYELFYDDERKLYVVHSLELQACPLCGAVLSGYDRRVRCSVSSDGNKYRYRLRRLKCTKCATLHVELLDFMQTQKHYERAVIEQALDNPRDCPADDSTIRRWKK